MRFDEYDALQLALQQTYGSSLVYLREWPVDYVSIDNTTITACYKIAATLRTTHYYHAILDKKYRGGNYCQELDIVIQGKNDTRPSWAQRKEN